MSAPPEHQPTREWTVATLKEYFERVIGDRDKALRLAVIDLDRRLTDVNHANALAHAKESVLFSREAHDYYAEQVSKEFYDIRQEMRDAAKTKWNILIPGFALLMTIIGTLWLLAVSPIHQEIKFLQGKIEFQQEEMRRLVKMNEDIIRERGWRK